MSKQPQKNRSGAKERRPVFLSFEFEKDADRRGTFIGLARKHCELEVIDNSLPSAQHDEEWRQTAKERIRSSHVVIVVLGPDTHNAPGVKDELSLAGEVRRPVVQLMPQDKHYGLVPFPDRFVRI